MDSLPCTLADVMAALARGATILTGNQRAARTLRGVYRSRQKATGLLTSPSPAVMPWEAWTASLWLQLTQQGLADRLLLSPLQERLVWREIIDADESVATMRSSDSLAKIAASAWKLLGQYGGREQLRRVATTSDTEAFAGWAERFERRCKANSLLSSSMLEYELRGILERSEIELPKKIFLAGFDRLTPAQSGLLESLRDINSAVQICGLRHDAAEKVDHSFRIARNGDEELQAAAQWAKQRLEQNPDARIALLVPNLEEERAEIDRVLRDVLAPELQEIGNHRPAPYEFSLGTPAANTAMVATAMDLLRWVVSPLAVERISGLLLSPYLGASATKDRGQHAEFDAFVLRQQKLLRPQLSLGAFLQIASTRSTLAILTRALAAARQIADERGFHSQRERGYAEWIEDVREVLAAAGWPGTRTLDSNEFQLRSRWEDVLDQIATLDFAGKRVGFLQALETLDRALRETQFSPESQGSPVQVMGVLESAGSTFDAVWFLRGSDESWPQQPRPHPLLPWQLQHSFAMPGMDATRSKQEFREVVVRLAASAPAVVFSYAAQGEDGPQHRSPVIAELEWPELDAELLSAPASPSATLESLADDVALPPLPQGPLRGGESVLRLQAACGFRAFAERRLWATELDTVSLGMDGLQWGNLLHDVVRRFWASVKTQDALRALSSEQLRVQIDTAIESSMRRTPEGPSAWDEAYLQTLRDRLTSLLSAWMPQELKRTPFEVSLSEEAFDVEVGALQLTLRVDRIDNVDGGQVLIDYKTGKVGVPGWLGPRPDDPQLPLYAAFAGGPAPLQAMAFAKLRAGDEMKLEGYDSGGGAIPKPTKLKTATLEEQLEEWRHVLLQLADDFAAGRADIDPKDYPQTCRHCGQRILCRLDTSTLQDNDEAGSEEDANG